MQSITISGTTYTLKPGSAAAEALTRPMKPYKIPRKGEKRTYPAYKAGVTSTADYVRVYYRANSIGRPDHFEPLNTAPAATYQGLDTVEEITE